MEPDRRWVDDPTRWEALAVALLKAGEAGIDSETYGQPNRTSPQHRTKISHWSIAVVGTRKSSRGYSLASGFGLPPSAFKQPGPLRDALQSITLWAHNAPHDEHSFKNEGLELAIQDTLQWSRVAAPAHQDYGLKGKGTKVGMEQWALGKKVRKGFMDLIKYVETETSYRPRTEKRCICGAVPCRYRQTSQWWDDKLGWYRLHERQEVVIQTEVVRDVEKRWEVTDFKPGHPRWSDWLDYVIVDAVSAIELVSWLRELRQPDLVYPWRNREFLEKAVVPRLR